MAARSCRAPARNGCLRQRTKAGSTPAAGRNITTMVRRLAMMGGRRRSNLMSPSPFAWLPAHTRRMREVGTMCMCVLAAATTATEITTRKHTRQPCAYRCPSEHSTAAAD
eukprot:4472777-Prymnesium_polylepis.3